MSLVIIAVTVAGTKRCTCQVGLVTFTQTTTCNFTATSDQFIACFLGLGQHCPYGCPFVIHFGPTPVSWRWKGWCFLKASSPHMPSFVICSKCVLIQGISSGWDVLHRSWTFVKHSLPAISYFGEFTRANIHHHHKSFYFRSDMNWLWCNITEYIFDGWAYYPCVPHTTLSFSCEKWCHIASSECMKDTQRLWCARTELTCNLMHLNFFPMPNAIHTSSAPIFCISVTRRTTTSVSDVLTIIVPKERLPGMRTDSIHVTHLRVPVSLVSRSWLWGFHPCMYPTQDLNVVPIEAGSRGMGWPWLEHSPGR